MGNWHGWVQMNLINSSNLKSMECAVIRACASLLAIIKLVIVIEAVIELKSSNAMRLRVDMLTNGPINVCFEFEKCTNLQSHHWRLSQYLNANNLNLNVFTHHSISTCSHHLSRSIGCSVTQLHAQFNCDRRRFLYTPLLLFFYSIIMVFWS